MTDKQPDKAERQARVREAAEAAHIKHAQLRLERRAQGGQ